MYPLEIAEVPSVVQLPLVALCQQQNTKMSKSSQDFSHWKKCKKPDMFLYYSLLQDAESKSETSQAISAREHFVFTDTDGQVYHITVEGNTVKDGARIPPDVSPETMCPFYVSFCFLFS